MTTVKYIEQERDDGEGDGKLCPSNFNDIIASNVSLVLVVVVLEFLKTKQKK